jgi:lipoprotein-releasing system ATP-binding protein
MASILSCHALTKRYSEGPQEIEVLNELSLQIEKGQRVAIIGASGSGKSTLLNLLGGLDKPDAGEVELDGQAFSKLNDNQRGAIRNRLLGFVYQFHHLLPEFTAVENIAMPMRIGGRAASDIHARCASLLDAVGLADRGNHKPAELSGGERQRVAIARALANEPACVLMDEPTGNLDRKNAEKIQALIKELSDKVRTSFIVVTHDEFVANQMDIVYELTSGQLEKVSS